MESLFRMRLNITYNFQDICISKLLDDLDDLGYSDAAVKLLEDDSIVLFFDRESNNHEKEKESIINNIKKIYYIYKITEG